MKTVLSIIAVMAVLFLSGCAEQIPVPLDSTETTTFSNLASEIASKDDDELCENAETQALSFQEHKMRFAVYCERVIARKES